ncbi:hydantoinase/oxoprolinase family protein [Nibrella saemangeumensis]|uniref:Hydantoinase/oxoprolinase family protein n=1 Tax=Nibrella saemangeumensis TaxID=1084526 RepID=A0ABP8MIV1_9BACT
MKKQVRVGIDVGGTFTDVVVVDHASREVISQLKVPTTHDATEGVALGIINAINRALSELSIDPEDVVFIAHSTTQATNALLEGDVAKVGIIGIGNGVEGLKAKIDTHIPAIELAPNRFLNAEHVFLSNRNLSETVLDTQLADFRRKGVEVVVTSEAFGVDNADNETHISDKARQLGFLATSGHEVSTLYGLRTRTRTAVINGAILPKMIHTATMTDACVKKSGITAPLMIMRSDGGVMSVEEVHRRPIMTMLSGPAAGIAGALMHERVSDGIFIEVGGTSADISVIRDGQPQTKAARVGGHRTYLNTLDVRTLAIAGGSMIREANGKIVDVGSRSAHIAGLHYACFQPAEIFENARLVHLRPTEKDADDYTAIETTSGKRFSLTPTCAANLLGIIPDTAFAKGNADAARLAFKPLADKIGKTVEEAAREVLDISCRKVAKQIDELIAEYHLDRDTVELIGGGGGAASLVLYTGELMKLPARLARKAEVISTIGVALAMVRDTVERNIVDPTPDDILAVRREAAEAVIKIGALPETVEVQMEVDTRRNLVRATAFGTTELKKDDSNAKIFTFQDCKASAARSMQTPAENVRLLGETGPLYVFGAERISKTFFGLFQSKQLAVRITDRTGVVRLQRNHAHVYATRIAEALPQLERVILDLTDFGDAGRSLPDIHLLVGARIINLSGLADLEQALALAATELENRAGDEHIVILAEDKK